MMEMPRVHICNEHGCRKVVPLKQRYCEEHAKLHQPFQDVTKEERHRYYKSYNANNRDHQANEFYHSKQWTTVRNYVVNRDMYSSAVTGRVLGDHDLIVDHIIRRDICDDPLDTSNLWCLSRSEHAIKTKIEHDMLAKPNGKNIIKHMARDRWIKYIRERTKSSK